MVPVSPISLANRYVVSTIPKPNYERPLLTQSSFSFTLVSPTLRAITPNIVDDPFGPLQSQRSSQPSSRKNNSPYIKKPYIQHIFYTEPHMIHIKDPLALAIEVLPPNWHFLPKVPEKSIKFYKSILIPGKVCSNRRRQVKIGHLSCPLPQTHHHQVCQL